MQVQLLRPPKCNSLCKNMSYDVWIIEIGPPIFCTANPLANSQNPMLYNTFQRPDTPESAHSRGGIYNPK